LADSSFQQVERLAADLPRLVHGQTFRQASVDCLIEQITWDDVLRAMKDPEIERLFMLYSYFASAYVHAPGMPAVNQIPAGIAVPLVRLAQKVDRLPILSYASYCLHNWRRIDADGPVALGNLELLQNFSIPNDGKKDEDWFILVHVNIEANAGAALQAVSAAKTILEANDLAGLESLLEKTAGSLQEMNQTMGRMPEGCSPEVYFKKVRPYIFGFNDIVYENCFGDIPQSYRGETGAQSSIVPTMLMALGIRHKSSLLTQHLEDMQNYMPAPHRQFIRQQPSVRELARRGASTGRIKEWYNACLAELIAFRSRHFEYAVNYIEKKVANPIATGGTPYVPWLRQLIEETKEFYIA
jgi:indoleamine 2,3-dioxygenase